MDLDEKVVRIYARIAELADVQPAAVTPNTRLEELGLDSSDAVIIALEVEELTGQEIDVGIFLRFDTLGESIAELSRILKGVATV